MSYKDTEVKLYDLIEKPYNDPLWDKLLDQLTVTEMVDLVSTGNYRTVRIDGIGKPQTIDSDGPMGFAAYMGGGEVHDTCYYASEAAAGRDVEQGACARVRQYDRRRGTYRA